MLLLTGCNANVEQLRQTNKELIKEVAVLKNQLQESEIKLNNVLKAKELETKDEVTSDFNIFNEGQFIKGDLYIPNTLSLKDIRDTFGEPIEIKESLGSHGSYKESILTYKNASFTFESIEDVDHIKWYTIKEPNIFTIRGVSVGSTASEVIQAYDKGFYNFHVSDDMIFFGEKTGMSFKFNKGIVIEIKVWFMYE
ncbi:hypothetical protein [Paenibacillus aquistagni]|uniref:hypothetical protein n=1 Tax=Paenibacillus aquistagni TaxID=1852522 RepID=UPI000B4FE810|nr:hypothetical protein [Paenibacillus aquistagni]NMM52906.1 hypothetical protein [Paenibacillus aquistagni]